MNKIFNINFLYKFYLYNLRFQAGIPAILLLLTVSSLIPLHNYYLLKTTSYTHQAHEGLPVFQRVEAAYNHHNTVLKVCHTLLDL